MTLTQEQLKRYHRHLILPSIGTEGQEKLLHARVLLVGAGGLGSPIALYLAAVGIGTLGIVDFDQVDLSNLQRQIIHGINDIGRPKVASAAETIALINPDVHVEQHETRLTPQNALSIAAQYDLLVDATDNFPSRYLANDAAVLTGKALVHGSIYQFDGQVTVFMPGQGPCYRCLFPKPPVPGAVPSSSTVGVIGVLPGIIGTIQALEAIKLVLNIGSPLIGRLVLFDALAMEFSEVSISRDPRCPICGDNPTIKSLVDQFST